MASRFEKFSERARRVLTLAQEEARHLNHSYIGTEHILLGLVREDEGVDQEYMLVQFTDFGPSSLDIFLYYFTKSTVWEEYLDVRQCMNLKIMDALEEMKLEFAFPTQTIHLAAEPDGLPREVKAQKE